MQMGVVVGVGGVVVGAGGGGWWWWWVLVVGGGFGCGWVGVYGVLDYTYPNPSQG